MSDWTTTVIDVRHKGEWGTFFVREWPVIPREDGKGFNASAEWVCNSTFGVYGHYWSSMGGPFADFIGDISTDYLLSKIGREITDSDKAAKELRRLVLEQRRERSITKDVARDALDDIEAILSDYSGDAACHEFYQSDALSKCHIEWCDLSCKEWCGQSLGFARTLWPEFVKQFCARSVLAPEAVV